MLICALNATQDEITQALKDAPIVDIRNSLPMHLKNETSELNRSLQRANENMIYGCMYSRVDSLRCFLWIYPSAI